MAEPRPFPPSVRRSSLARAAGLHPASPILVGAFACAVAVIAVGALGRAAAARLGSWVIAACESPARLPGSPEPGLDATTLPTAMLELALPLLAAVALAASVAHLVQTGAVWLPRRRLRGAPTPAPHRVRRAGVDLAAALVIGSVVVCWLWIMAPRLAAAIGAPLASAALIASLLAALAIGWVILGTGDALIRHAELSDALRMSHAERREDDRLSGADPRWRARRAQIGSEAKARRTRTRGQGASGAPNGATTSERSSLLVLGDDLASEIAGSSTLLLGDGVAVAIAWDPARRPVPTATAIGRGVHATQLLGLARRHAIAVHRDHELTAALATTVGALPEVTWPRLAEIIAATRGRRRSI